MYSHVFVGGTFDRLHKGHESLLVKACEVGDRVTVGLTSDEFVSRFRPGQKVASYAERKSGVLAWMTDHGVEEKVTVIAINDPYEPAASMEDLDALLVTPDNKSRGDEINAKRKEKGLEAVALLEVALVAAEDTKPISATRVRMGEIDPDGKLVLPDALRPELARPLGIVLVGDAIGSSLERNRDRVIIAVGDITTGTLLTAGIIPNLICVDYLVHRAPYRDLEKKFKERSLETIEVVSGPGYIARDAVKLIEAWATRPTDKKVIVVHGEEDLLTLPAVSYAPTGSVVYYGQPDKGLVEVVVDEKSKALARTLLGKFTS